MFSTPSTGDVNNHPERSS
ncbi:uncharacterized protein DNG_01963 [Cephalotrichum gorgonifer]|uniref:Uncharacterized protein n=1 Tax=Cephalotrichum gorgonifer TaxID=2041049 RepID=A0AAE8SSV0_9PEZI|nr:uncharacterized protein DNG_01963 [Cephalotrichum gorgonifer]